MENRKLDFIMRAYNIVKSVLNLEGLSREEELNNELLMNILERLHYEFRDDNGWLYDDKEDIYIYCGKNGDPEKSIFVSLGGKRVEFDNKEDFKAFVDNNTVLFHDLDFNPSTDKMTSIVLPRIREEYYLKAFNRNNEDKAKVYVLGKYAHMHKSSEFDKTFLTEKR